MLNNDRMAALVTALDTVTQDPGPIDTWDPETCLAVLVSAASSMDTEHPQALALGTMVLNTLTPDPADATARGRAMGHAVTGVAEYAHHLRTGYLEGLGVTPTYQEQEADVRAAEPAPEPPSGQDALRAAQDRILALEGQVTALQEGTAVLREARDRWMKRAMTDRLSIPLRHDVDGDWPDTLPRLGICEATQFTVYAEPGDDAVPSDPPETALAVVTRMDDATSGWEVRLLVSQPLNALTSGFRVTGTMLQARQAAVDAARNALTGLRDYLALRESYRAAQQALEG